MLIEETRAKSNSVPEDALRGDTAFDQLPTQGPYRSSNLHVRDDAAENIDHVPFVAGMGK